MAATTESTVRKEEQEKSERFHCGCGRLIFEGRLGPGTYIKRRCRDCKQVTIITR